MAIEIQNNWRCIASSCISMIVIVHNLLENLINGTIGWKSASTTNIFHGIPKVCLKSKRNKWLGISAPSFDRPVYIPCIKQQEQQVQQEMNKNVRRANDVGRIRLDKAP